MHSKILATGSYLPQNAVTNYDLEKKIDTSHDWIVERTGIEQRHLISGAECTSFMAYEAAIKAISNAGIKAEDIDLVLFATCTPDQVMPSMACVLQERLGIRNGSAAMDLDAACSGFVYALTVADSLIKTGQAKCALVVGSEAMSTLIDWNERATSVLFGDGAGAVILVADNTPGIISTVAHADGSYKDLLYVKDHIHMSGKEVFKTAVTNLSATIESTLKKNNLTLNDLDWMVPHQANIRIIKAVGNRLEFPEEKVIVTVNKHANTSAASIPLALDYGVSSGKIKRGDLLILAAFGAGFTWGSTLVRY